MTTDGPPAEKPRNQKLLRRATILFLVLSIVFCVAGLLFYFRITPGPYGVLKRLMGGRLHTVMFLIWPVLTLICGVLLLRGGAAKRLGAWAEVFWRFSA